MRPLWRRAGPQHPLVPRVSSNYVVFTQKRGKDLVVIDVKTHAVAHRMPIQENGGSEIQMQADGNRVFIACPRDHFVAVVDLQMKPITTIAAGREPDGLGLH